MYTSGIETKRAVKTAFVYLLISVFCGIFGGVYELFSHEVYSYYMIYAFGFPFVGGALPFLLLSLCSVQTYPNPFARNLYHSAIATLTTGSIIRGVLDIYGTTNRLAAYYWIVGVPLLVLGSAAYCAQCLRRKTPNSTENG